MAEFIQFKQPISVASTIKVDGVELGLNAFTDTTIPTNNNTLTNGAGYITSTSTNTLTNKSGNISQWTNDSGYITDAGDNNYVDGMSFNKTNGILTLSRSGLTDLTQSLDGRYLTSASNFYLNGITKAGNVLTFSVLGATNQTYTFGANAFNGTTIYAEPGIFSGGGTPSLAAGVTAAEIRTLIGAGTSSTTGTVTSVTGTAGLQGTGSGSVQISVDYSGAGNIIDTAADGTTVEGKDMILYEDATDSIVKEIPIEAILALAPQGDITSVGAGTGMTGGGSSGGVTLNVIGGTGITANANNITIDATVATLAGTQTFTNKSGAISQWTNDSGYTTLAIGTTGTTAKAGNVTTISTAQAKAITDNTAKVGITTTQASNITTNNAKVSDTGTPAILSNGTTPSLNAGISAAEVRTLIGAGTSSSAGVTSVGGTGTISGISLSGTVTSTGNLTLGGKLALTSANVTGGLGFTPYNATNPAGYTSLAIGTTASTAKAGNTTTITGAQATAIVNNTAKVSDTGTPAMLSNGTVPSLNSGISAAEVRGLIGAGTSSLTIGTTASTAKAGNTTTITGAQATAIVNNTKKVTDTGTPAILSNGTTPSLNSGISAAEVRTLIGAGTSSSAGVTSVSGTANRISVTSGATPTVNAITGAVNSSSANLATGAQIQTAIDSAVTGVLKYMGTWNAATNVPTLASAKGNPGEYYIVSTAGSTNLDGITDWAVGDWAVFSDLATDAWQKIDNTQVGNVTGSGSSGRIAYWNGSTNVTSDAGLTFNGSTNALTVGGAVTWSGGGSTESNSAYDNSITGFSDSGSSTKTLTLTQRDGGTLTTSFSVPQGTTTPSNTQTFTNKSGAISQWTNDSGYKTTDNNTTYSAGSGITLTGTVFSNASPNIVQTTITGNAGSATKLLNARTISGVSFNGTANITLNNSNITNGKGYTTNTGTTTASNAQTFTNKGGNISQWTNDSKYITSYVNTTYSAGSGITLTGTVFSNAAPNVVQTTITGNAGSATVLQTARTISGVSFNGSANITLNNANITNGAGYVTKDTNTTYTAGSGITLTGTVFSNAAPNVVQTTITGNAGSATKLLNARTIAGVSFNGTANISLNNNAITNGAGYTTNTGTTTASNTQTFTNKSGNISQWTNNSGYTTNTGDITNVIAGSYLSGGGTSGSVTLNVQAETASKASTVVARDSSGDINVRLLRSEYDSTNASIGYVMTQVDTISNNYVRPSTMAQLRASLNVANGATNVTNNNQLTNGAGYTGNTGTTTASNSQTFTNKGGNISQWTNDSGYSTKDTNTTYTAGSGLALTGTVFSNTSPNVTQTTVSGNAGTATRLQTARTIAGVSFNGTANIALDNKNIANGAGYTTNTGDITGVTAGSNLTGGGSSGTVSLAVSSSPSFSNVYVAGQILHTGDTDTYMQFHNANQWRVVAGGGEKLEVNTSGVIVTGTIVASSNITAYSDERLKSNVETIPNALEKVNALRGVSFDKDGERGLGVIAQEVEKVLPEVVLDGEEYKSVAYGNMVGVLIEAIKELTKEVEDLKKQIK